MHTWSRTILLVGLLLVMKEVSAQDSIYSRVGKILPEDFHPTSPVIDSDASVVVLQDIGEAEVVGWAVGWRVVYTRYRRLLIRNRKGFDAARVALSFDPYKNRGGKLASLQASTYNLDSGRVRQTKLDTADIFLEGSCGNVKERFSFPDVREGSIIEYAYTIFAGSIFDLHYWDFQSEYPCLESSYSVSFPAVFNYVVTRQGLLPLTRTNDSLKTMVSVGSYNLRTEVYISHWKIKDVPAFKEEPYMSSPDNYVTGIRFQLSEYTELKTEKRKKFLDNWKMLNESFYKDKAFGGIMTTSSHFLRKEVRTIVEDSVNEMGKARALFAYVRDHFSNTGRSIISDDNLSLKDIFKARKGSVAEINLLLTAMLREEGIPADAIILSTRDNGYINPYYPLLENFNYVVVRSQIAGDTYYLDATKPRIGFGHLPSYCYNGYARVVSERPDSVIFQTDSLEESRRATVLLTSNASGDSLSGSYTVTKGYYSSLDIRDEVVEKGEEAYFDKVRKSYPFEVNLTDRRIDSLQAYDQPVTIHYTLSFATGGGDRLYFNPLLSEALKANLFAAADRRYPVEMSYGMNELFVMRMDIPEGYEIEELPKPVRVRLNDSDGSYEYVFLAEEHAIQFRSRLVLKRTVFQPEDYQSLRDFFAQVVKKQNEFIVFRKKK